MAPKKVPTRKVQNLIIGLRVVMTARHRGLENIALDKMDWLSLK